MSRAQVEHYIGRATDFYAGMTLTPDDLTYRSSAALLTIHSAISYADALRTALGDERLSNEDHRVAIVEMKRLLTQRSLGDESVNGLKHFQSLIGMKSFVSYGAQPLDAKRLAVIILDAERFANWVSRVARKLRVEGWRYEDD